MSFKEKFNALIDRFKSENADKFKEVKEKFETLVLQDGTTEVTIEPAVEVGAAIVIAAEDGTPVPAPAGEYILQDGRTIVVTEDGIIAEVKEAATEGDMPGMPEGEAPEEMEEETPSEAKVKRLIESIVREKVFASEESFNALVKRVSDNEKTIKFLKGENETLVDKNKELLDTIDTQFNQIKDLVGAEPVKDAAVKKENPLDKFFAGSDSNYFYKHKK